MTEAHLRGFDFPEQDTDDQLRFCIPLLSFDDGKDSQIYYANDLEWRPDDDGRIPSLTIVDIDEIESFASMVTEPELRIRSGQGVVLIGQQILDAIRTAGLTDPCSGGDIEFACPRNASWLIGCATVDSFRDFATQMMHAAVLVFDNALAETSGNKLSSKAEAALFLLRKGGIARPTDLAIRQLAASRITSQVDRYRRLLIRFSRKLEQTESHIHDRVVRYLEQVRGQVRTTPEYVPSLVVDQEADCVRYFVAETFYSKIATYLGNDRMNRRDLMFPKKQWPDSNYELLNKEMIASWKYEKESWSVQKDRQLEDVSDNQKHVVTFNSSLPVNIHRIATNAEHREVLALKSSQLPITLGQNHVYSS